MKGKVAHMQGSNLLYEIRKYYLPNAGYMPRVATLPHSICVNRGNVSTFFLVYKEFL